MRRRRPTSWPKSAPATASATRVVVIDEADHWHGEMLVPRGPGPWLTRASDATVEQRQGSVGWPLLIVLASLAAVAPVSTDLYLPGFPAVGQELDASASAVQLTLTTFLVGLAAGQLVMGPLSDRYGRRPPLLVSTAV